MSDIPNANDLKKIKEDTVTGRTRITFGKYKGQMLCTLPDPYCYWLLNECKLDHPFSAYLEDRLEDYDPRDCDATECDIY